MISKLREHKRNLVQKYNLDVVAILLSSSIYVLLLGAGFQNLNDHFIADNFTLRTVLLSISIVVCLVGSYWAIVASRTKGRGTLFNVVYILAVMGLMGQLMRDVYTLTSGFDIADSVFPSWIFKDIALMLAMYAATRTRDNEKDRRNN